MIYVSTYDDRQLFGWAQNVANLISRVVEVAIHAEHELGKEVGVINDEGAVVSATAQQIVGLQPDQVVWVGQQ